MASPLAHANHHNHPYHSVWPRNEPGHGMFSNTSECHIRYDSNEDNSVVQHWDWAHVEENTPDVSEQLIRLAEQGPKAAKMWMKKTS